LCPIPVYNYCLMAGRNVVGERVRLARRMAKPPIKQTELAARLQTQGIGLSQPSIAKIEAGKRPVIDVEVAALAQALGVSVGWLFGEVQEHK